MELFAAFTTVDAIAVGVVFLCWFGIRWLIEHPPATRPSVSVLMVQYRREWMAEMVTRNPRIFDGNVLATLREGTSFFASATMIALGGGLALMTDPAPLEGLAEGLGQGARSDDIWVIKLLLAMLFLASAFLSFVWSHRLFGYCAVVMASVPNDVDDPTALSRAAKAAEINITAARSFNRALRAVYFGIAALAWLAGPWALLGAVSVTFLVLWRREFASASRQALLRPDLP